MGKSSVGLSIKDSLLRSVLGIRGASTDLQQGAKDLLASVSPQVVALVTQAVSAVLIARGLGPSSLGRYALVMSLTAIVVSLSDLGLNQTGIRYASRAAAHGNLAGQMSVLRWSFRLRLTLAAIVTVIFFIAVPFIAKYFWHDQQLSPLLRLGLFTGVIGVIAGVPSIYYLSLKRFKSNAIILCVQRLLLFGGILIIALFGLWSLFNILVFKIVFAALGAAVGILVIPQAAIWPPKNISLLKDLRLRHFWASPDVGVEHDFVTDTDSPNSFAFYHLLSTIFIMLILQADVWMIGHYHNKEQLGYYSAAIYLTLPLTVFLNSLTTILWPRASGHTTFEHAVSLLKKTFRVCGILAILCLIYAMVVPVMAPVLFGSEYKPSVLFGHFLCIRYCIAFLICPMDVVSYNFGLVRVYWIVFLFQLIVMVLICLILLPRIGPLGAAIALISQDLFGAIIRGSLILKKVWFYKNLQ